MMGGINLVCMIQDIILHFKLLFMLPESKNILNEEIKRLKYWTKELKAYSKSPETSAKEIKNAIFAIYSIYHRLENEFYDKTQL